MPKEPSQELTIIERFRESHHAVARMFASGMTPSMIRGKTGYSQRRLTLLWNDPSFQELINIYAQRIGEKWEASVDAYLDLGLSNMLRSEGMIAERLDEAMNEGATPVPLAILDRISQGRADRFGYSKHSTVEHKHDFASQLDRAISRSGKVDAVKQIEGQATEVPPEQQLPTPQRVGPPLATKRVQPRSFTIVNIVKKRKVA